MWPVQLAPWQSDIETVRQATLRIKALLISIYLQPCCTIEFFFEGFFVVVVFVVVFKENDNLFGLAPFFFLFFFTSLTLTHFLFNRLFAFLLKVILGHFEQGGASTLEESMRRRVMSRANDRLHINLVYCSRHSDDFKVQRCALARQGTITSVLCIYLFTIYLFITLFEATMAKVKDMPLRGKAH